MPDQDINDLLIAAIERNIFQEVKNLFEQTPRPNLQWKTDRDFKPLYLAALKGNAPIVEYLLEQGAPLYLGDDTPQTTALHLAASRVGRNYRSIVQALLRLGRERGNEELKKYVNHRDVNKKTALHHAAAAGVSEDIKALVKAGANVNLRDEYELLAVHHACINRKWDVMEYLFKRDSSSINNKMTGGPFGGSTCLHVATKRNCGKAVHYLVELMSDNGLKMKDSDNMTAWDVACVGTASALSPDPEDREAGGNRKVRRATAFRPSSHRVASYQSPSSRLGDTSYTGSTLAPIFPINLEAASVLVAKDLKSRRRREARFEYQKYHIGGTVCYSLRENHFGAIYALVGELLATNDIRIQVVDRFIQGFQYEQYLVDPENQDIVSLKLREPSCTVTTGKSFLIAMPYFEVLTRPEIKKWRDPTSIQCELDKINKVWNLCSSEPLESLKAPYVPLTLDEYCCPALPKAILDRRNRDQVLTKATDPNDGQDSDQVWDTAMEPESDSTELITICQLWILQWPGGLITAYMHSDPEAEHIPIEIPSWAHDCVTGDIKKYIGITLSHFVDGLDRPSKTGSGDPIFNTFEKWIARLVQKVDNYSRGKEVARFDVNKERKFLHDIDDVRGELGMIKRVILQQEEVWKTFASNAWPEHWSSGPEGRMVIKDVDAMYTEEEEDEWQLVLRAQSQFDRYRRRIAQLDEDAERMEKSIMVKLDLKQKHASLRESHATALMSAAVLGFTVITIIFTPLSFLTSLFALSIDRFQKNQIDFFIPNRENEADFTNRTRVYSTNYIGKWAATTEIVSTVVALVAMWLVIEYGMEVPVLRYCWEWVKRSFKRSKSGEGNQRSDGGDRKIDEEKPAPQGFTRPPPAQRGSARKLPRRPSPPRRRISSPKRPVPQEPVAGPSWYSFGRRQKHAKSPDVEAPSERQVLQKTDTA